MRLYSDSGIDSHIVRFILAIKEADSAVMEININPRWEIELEKMIGSQRVPTFVDRDSLCIYGLDVIISYLDERLPHPTLLPGPPISRAKLRFWVYQLRELFFSTAKLLLKEKSSESTEDRKEKIHAFLEDLTGFLGHFPAGKFLYHNTLTVLDCFVLPLLWRAFSQVKFFPGKAKLLQLYAERSFEDERFLNSLTPTEKDWGEIW